VYQPLVLKPGDATSASGCGAFATSCNRHPASSTTGCGGVDFAAAVIGVSSTSSRTANLDAIAKRNERSNRMCNGLILQNFLYTFARLRAPLRRIYLHSFQDRKCEPTQE
jgi:hypothetical protein